MTTVAPRAATSAMKTPSILTLLCLAAQPLLAAEPAKTAEPRSSRVLLQEALFAEEAERDLEKASAGYTEILEQFAMPRTLAATALYHLAEIRAKQNKKADAIALHQRLLAEFPKEEALAKLSRDRLAELGATAPAVAAGGAEAISAKETEELARLRRMVRDSPDLLEAPNDSTGETPLVLAASSGWAQAATFLLDHHVAINGRAGPWVPLHWAADNGRKRMVELLLERGADVNAVKQDGWTALQAAVNRNYLEVARVLLEHGAKTEVETDRNQRSTYKAGEGTPLVVAVRKGAVDLVKLLLEKGADANFASHDPELTPLGVAAETGSLELVKLLLEYKANIDRPQQSKTPLIVATLNNRVEVVKLLLKSGARVDPADDTGATALHYAAAAAEPLVELLLAAGASPKAVTKTGLTPLHFTVLPWSSVRQANSNLQMEGGPSQRLPIASMPKVWDELVARGGELNAVDDRGYSLLHFACGVSELPISALDQLIRKGADPELKAKDGSLPFWFSPQRDALEQALLFPKLVKKQAVTVLDRDNRLLGRGQTYEPATDAPEPPTWEMVLKKATGVALRPTWKVRLYRADAEGHVKEAGSAEGQMTPVKAAGLPKLQWGDVVVVSSGEAVILPPTGALSDPARRLRVINARQ
jgi:ankyrin repeat protein